MKKVITIKASASIIQAKAKMTSHEIRHLPVVDENNRLIGIISDRDIRSAMPYQLKAYTVTEPGDREISRIPVSEVMTSNPYTISDTYTLQDVLLLFIQTKVGAFPVIDANRRIIGIISYKDLLKIFIHFLGVEQPGDFLVVQNGETVSSVEQIFSAICRERIPIASMQVIRPRGGGQKVVVMYLLTKQIGKVRRLVEQMGFSIVNPLRWFLNQFRSEYSEPEITD